MPSKLYIRNVCFRIPGSTTRSCTGPRILLGLLERKWSPHLYADDDDLDEAESGIAIIEGDFGVTRIYSKKQFKRILRKQWMGKNQDGTDRDLVAETYPGNLFDQAFQIMAKQDAVSLEEAVRIQKAAASYSNFVATDIDPEWEALMGSAELPKRTVAEKLNGAFGIADDDDDDDDDEPVPTESQLPEDDEDEEVPAKQPIRAQERDLDDLTKIRGVGDDLETELREAGYATISSIAEADPEDLADKVDGIGNASAVSICQSATNLLASQLAGLDKE